MDDQAGQVSTDSWIDDPVFADGEHLQVEVAVALQVLVGGVRGNHLDDQQGADVLPT